MDSSIAILFGFFLLRRIFSTKVFTKNLIAIRAIFALFHRATFFKTVEKHGDKPVFRLRLENLKIEALKGLCCYKFMNIYECLKEIRHIHFNSNTKMQ